MNRRDVGFVGGHWKLHARDGIVPGYPVEIGVMFSISGLLCRGFRRVGWL